MQRGKAVFISSGAVLLGSDHEKPEEWSVNPAVAGLLRDMVTRRQRVIILINQDLHGLSFLSPGDRSGVKEWMRAAFMKGYSDIPGSLHVMTEESPSLLWGLARQCGLNLARSLFVGVTKGEEQMAADAGVSHFEWAEDFFRTRVNLAPEPVVEVG